MMVMKRMTMIMVNIMTMTKITKMTMMIKMLETVMKYSSYYFAVAPVLQSHPSSGHPCTNILYESKPSPSSSWSPWSSSSPSSTPPSPGSLVVKRGSTVSLKCQASGFPLPKVRSSWLSCLWITLETLFSYQHDRETYIGPVPNQFLGKEQISNQYSSRLLPIWFQNVMSSIKRNPKLYQMDSIVCFMFLGKKRIQDPCSCTVKLCTVEKLWDGIFVERVAANDIHKLPFFLYHIF